MLLNLQTATPFLKWVGGKTQNLREYRQLFPKIIQTYHEPFLGGSAVFFHLLRNGLIQKAILSDMNTELIITYQELQRCPQDVIDKLRIHNALHSELYYYNVREMDRNESKMSRIEMAARMIYLNKTCYNGLYRVNQKGQFNTPKGRYTNPKILDVENLYAVHDALQSIEIFCQDVFQTEENMQSGDFVFFDPPYDPISATSNFTAYTSQGFSNEQQIKLAQMYSRLTEKGVQCLLSNSDTEFIRELYADYQIYSVCANRMLNCKSSQRGKVDEVVIANYTI